MSILALGESTHGTKEFNTIKDYIIRNQILFNNVKAVAMEVEFCGLLGLNDYLLNNRKPLDSALVELDRSAMSGIYFTKEVLEMVRWIKQYNLTKESNKDKVQLMGLDMQNPYLITKAILERFPQLEGLNKEDFSKVQQLNSLYYPRKDVKLSSREKDVYKILADRLAALVRSQASATDTLYLVHLTDLLKQTLTLRGGTLHYKTYREKRDAYMAAHTIWIHDKLLSNRSKMVIWAHNGHIAHEKLDGTHRMGYHLQEHYKEKYYAVDLVFDEGSVRIYDFKGTKRYKPFYYATATNDRSIEYGLRDAASPLFFLDVSGTKNTLLQTFFGQHPYQRVIGAMYQSNPDKDYEQMPVLRCFDGVIFIKKANAAENIR